MILPDLEVTDSFAYEILSFILKNEVLGSRRFVIERENEFNGDYPVLLKSVFDCICNSNLPLTPVQKKLWLITVGEYMYRGNFVIDPEINFYCLLLALSEINAS